MRRPLAVAFGLATLLASRVVLAASCTASTSGLSFGTYDPFSPSPVSITGTVTVTCQVTVGLLFGYSIQLDGGTGGTVAARAMSSGANRLGYQLYTTATHTTVWGDGTSGSVTVSDSYLVVLFTTAKPYTIYGYVPALQMVAPGGYSDTVTVLVTY
jgi:spore coat protein U-like protein